MSKTLFIITQAEAGQRLDQFLVQGLRERTGQAWTRAQVKALLDAGAVTINQRRAWKAGFVLAERARIVVALPAAAREAARVELTAASILYEDDALVVIDKPAGLPTHETPDGERDHAVAALTRFLAARDGGKPYLGLHHRLDAGTSGVLLFAKDPRANGTLTERFRERAVHKCYRAVATASALPPETWEVDNHLDRVTREGAKVASVRAGGQPAQTAFRRLAWRQFGDGVVLDLEARPHTGRMHQIRVHLSEAGRPIVGDTMYGGLGAVGDWRPGRMLLHAWRLELEHPLRAQALAIEAPLPEGWWPWPPSEGVSP